MNKQRTFKFYGYPVGESVTFELAFGDTRQQKTIPAFNITDSIFNRTIDDLVQIAEISIDINAVGHIPLTLTVLQGSMLFGAVTCNYTRSAVMDGFIAFNDLQCATPPSELFWYPTYKTEFKLNSKINSRPAEQNKTGIWLHYIQRTDVYTCDINFPANYSNIIVPVGWNAMPYFNVDNQFKKNLNL